MARRKYITRTAKSGEPSVLWISKRGNYYATVIDAKKDNPARAIQYHAATGRIIMPPPPPAPEIKPGSGKILFPPPKTVTTTAKTTPPTSKSQHTAFYAVVGAFIALLIYKIFK